MKPEVLRLLQKAEQLTGKASKTKRRHGLRCKRCRQRDPEPGTYYCLICRSELDKEIKERNANRELTKENSYTYAYDSEGKLGLLHRQVMEKLLGRKLEKHETVHFKDGVKSNCAPENLYVGFKGSIPIDSLVCNCCETKGNFRVEGTT